MTYLAARQYAYTLHYYVIFDQVLGWFWEIVFGMSQEEMARLLQFTTGSSQVPPGGFKELVPKFQINFHPGRDVLPTAHTW